MKDSLKIPFEVSSSDYRKWQRALKGLSKLVKSGELLKGVYKAALYRARSKKSPPTSVAKFIKKAKRISDKLKGSDDESGSSESGSDSTADVDFSSDDDA